MSAIIGGAAAAGTVVGDFIIKYQRSFYDKKIKKLESIYGELDKKLSSLKGYKESLPSAWNDEQAKSYSIKLSTQIVAVKNSMDLINNVKRTYEDIIADMDRSTQTIDDTIGKVGNLIGSLGIKE